MFGPIFFSIAVIYQVGLERACKSEFQPIGKLEDKSNYQWVREQVIGFTKFDIQELEPDRYHYCLSLYLGEGDETLSLKTTEQDIATLKDSLDGLLLNGVSHAFDGQEVCYQGMRLNSNYYEFLLRDECFETYHIEKSLNVEIKENENTVVFEIFYR